MFKITKAPKVKADQDGDDLTVTHHTGTITVLSAIIY